MILSARGNKSTWSESNKLEPEKYLRKFADKKNIKSRINTLVKYWNLNNSSIEYISKPKNSNNKINESIWGSKINRLSKSSYT